MQIYLVGGAVRDQLLGDPVEERDWVVVGSTVEELLAQGYQPVGKDFPVFLHPVTKEEYALARTERKQGRGYKGFICYASPEVTLEEDLARRDLTLNAIAQDEQGQLIDPFGGQADLEKRLLKHVSPAFVEDPVRVLRLARFAARYASRGFTVAPETLSLVKEMVQSGELAHLVPERVWQELQKALSEKEPAIFFQILAAGEALTSVFSELPGLTESSALESLNNAVKSTPDVEIRLASLLQNLAFTSLKKWCQHFPLPVAIREIILLSAECQSALTKLTHPEAVLNLLENLDAFRRPARFQKILQVWQANSLMSHPEEAIAFLQKAQTDCLTVDIPALVQAGFQGANLGKAIHRIRLDWLNKTLLHSHPI